MQVKYIFRGKESINGGSKEWMNLLKMHFLLFSIFCPKKYCHKSPIHFYRLQLHNNKDNFEFMNKHNTLI